MKLNYTPVTLVETEKGRDTKNCTGLSPTGNRAILADILPLDTPLVVQVFSIYSCNLACCFCHYGLEKEKRPFIAKNRRMDFNLYKKCIDDLATFNHKIKLLRFCSEGEPLLDKNIVRMIEYASEKKVAENIEVLSNGLLLTGRMSRDLIAAGITRLRISIYGVNSQMYRKMCGKEIDFDTLVENIRTFYHLKKESGKKISLYVKTMNCTLADEKEQEQFVSIFRDICDTYAIEQVMPNIPGIDYSRWIKEGHPNTNTMGYVLPSVKVCPQPFYLLTINPDGMIIPCVVSYNSPIGDATKASIKEIWNGPVREFQTLMLDGIPQAGKICAACTIGRNRPFPEDLLDDDAERLKKIFSQ
jgi:MoaA/NifB/PqqE/SkfB family radical SAM enzyme